MEGRVRRAINQAHDNYKNSKLLSFEIFLISVGLGLGVKSWWVFGGALVGLYIVLLVPYLGTVLLLLLSAIWGYIGWEIGSLFKNVGAQVVLGALAFLSGVGVHFSARQWFEDNSRS